VSTEEALIFLHLLGAFWYVMGLTSVQISLVRSWDRENPSARADSIEEASHYQGILLVPGAIAAVSTGVFLWALDYNLITTPWLVIVEALFAVTLLSAFH
jgi:F0F1-type ATP synthase assembly protein I